MVVVALLALSFVSDGVPGARASHDPSTHVATVQSGPVAPVPVVRRHTSIGDWSLRADRAGGGRGAALVALVGLLWLLGLGARTEHRAPDRTWTGLAHRRHSISLRAPPAPCLT